MQTESPHDRFKRLATKRTNAVMEKLRVLSNCSNRSLYDYSESDVNKIFSVIEKELKDVKAKFQPKRHRKFIL